MTLVTEQQPKETYSERFESIRKRMDHLKELDRRELLQMENDLDDMRRKMHPGLTEEQYQDAWVLYSSLREYMRNNPRPENQDTNKKTPSAKEIAIGKLKSAIKRRIQLGKSRS